MAVIIRSIDNNKTTVCHLAIPREFSHLLWYGEEIECEVTGGDGNLPHLRQIEDFQAQGVGSTCKTLCRRKCDPLSENPAHPAFYEN